MKLTYIYHSGFVIETKKCIIILDFYEDTSGLNKGFVHDEVLKAEKKIYVLSSHSHNDHFSPDILKWKNNNSNIEYIFSFDIKEQESLSDISITYLNKLDTYTDELIDIKAFGSTDLGISFLIKCEGRTIFHAGDLNNWHWKEESTDEEIAEAEHSFFSELDLLENETKDIDLAMFPVDPRLGTDYMLGAKQFINRFNIGIFAPMHFGESYDKASAFAVFTGSKGIRFFDIKQKGDSITF